MLRTKQFIFALGLCLVSLGPFSITEIQAQSSRAESPEVAVKSKSKKRALDFTKHGAIVYRQTDEFQLKCDVYVPDGDGPYPAVIAIHGGGWHWGSKFMMLRHAWLMAKKGYVVVAINYRHAPEFRFPAQIDDCKYAVRWMRANAKKYKIDPQRIGAYGYSAGGHLAALLGTTDADDGFDDHVADELKPFSSKVSAVVAAGAPCEFSWVGDESSMLSYWLGSSRKRNPKIYAQASPINFVTADDAPFYFYHGGYDFTVPIESAKKMHQRLQDTGVPSSFDVVEKTGHVITFSKLGYLRRGVKFFDKHLKPSSGKSATNRYGPSK